MDLLKVPPGLPVSFSHPGKKSFRSPGLQEPLHVHKFARSSRGAVCNKKKSEIAYNNIVLNFSQKN